MLTVFIEVISGVNRGEKDGQRGFQIVLILYGVTEASPRQKISCSSEEVMLDNHGLGIHSIESEAGGFRPTDVGRQVPNHEMFGTLGP